MYKIPTVYETENQTKLARLLLWEALLAARVLGELENRSEMWYITEYFQPTALFQGPWKELFDDCNRKWLATCGRRGALRSATLQNYLGRHTTSPGPWESEHRRLWIDKTISLLLEALASKQYAIEGQLFSLRPKDYEDKGLRRELALLLAWHCGFGEAGYEIRTHITTLYTKGH